MICAGCGENLDSIEDVADHALCDWPDAAFTKNRNSIPTLEEKDDSHE